MARRTNSVKELEVVPQIVRQGDALTLRGADWGGCPLEVRVDGLRCVGIHIARGFRAPGAIQLDPHGSFVVLLPTLGLAPGEHRVQVAADRTRRSARFTGWQDMPNVSVKSQAA